MGNFLGGILKPISQIASLIPSPIQPYAQAASAIFGLSDAQKAQKDQEAAMNKAFQGQTGALGGLQSLIGGMGPYMDQTQGIASRTLPMIEGNALDTYRLAREYDPARETEQATSTYDQAAGDSLRRDLASGAIPSLERGFGRGSSDFADSINKVLGARAVDRAKFIGGLRASERSRKMDFLNNAGGSIARSLSMTDPAAKIGALTSPLLGIGAQYGNLAGQRYGMATAGDTSGLQKTAADAIGALPWGQIFKPKAPKVMKVGAQ